MAQQQVVDVAALSRIGRATQDEKREPNRSMDRFMEFAGGVAVQLFSGAFKAKQALNAKNQNFISEKSTDLRDLNPTLKNIIQNEYDEIGANMADGTNKQVGLLGVQLTKNQKNRSQEGVNILTNEKNRALNIHTDIKNYVKEQKRYYDIHASNLTTDENGSVKRVTWGQHNLPEDLVFTQFYAEGKLDEFITFDKSSGKLGINQNVTETLTMLALDENFNPNSKDVLKALRAANKKEGEFVIQEDWNLAEEDTSHKGNNINSGILELTGQNGNVGKWDNNMSVRYRDYINTQILGNGDDIAGMNENDIASYFFSKGLVDDFVDDPDFDVIIDHDGDPNTPDAVFDGEEAWIQREFEDKGYKYSRDVTATDDNGKLIDPEAAAKYARWRQGVMNELRANMDFNSPEVIQMLEDDYMSNAKDEHNAIWKNSKNNPNNQTSDTKIADWQYKAQVRQQDAINLQASFESGEEFTYTIGEGASRKERKVVNNKNNPNESIIYQRVADSEEGTYKWIEVERKSSLDAYNEIIGSEFPLSEEGVSKYGEWDEDISKKLKETEQTKKLNLENPIIEGTSFRYDQFEKRKGKWYLKGTETRMKDKNIVNQLNKII